MRISIAILITLIISCDLCAQSKFWDSPQAYLGQRPPLDTPQIFAPDLLAQRDTFAFDRVAWSDDGKEFYYPSNNSWFDSKNSKIRYFKYAGGKWNGPFVLNEHYYAPTFSVDGKTLYLEGGQRDSLYSQIWQSHRTAKGWSKPEIYLKEPYGLYDFMPTASGICYAGSNQHPGKRRDFSDYDICTLTMRSGDTTMTTLGEPVNTPAFDGDFFVARDESYMIISAKETKDFECELWISFRRLDNSWTGPVSLGPLINDGVAHRWGEYVSPDGRYLFYARGTSPKDCHIYWVRFDRLLKQLKDQAKP